MAADLDYDLDVPGTVQLVDGKRIMLITPGTYD